MEPSDTEPNGEGLSRSRIMHAVDESLRRLQTDYIDLYQIHTWDEGTPIEETLSTLNDLVRMGKVRYLGASNLLGWQLQKIVDVSRHNGWLPWVSLQQQYSLLCRESELDAFCVCKNEGIGILPWSPLKGGWLSGKYKKNMQQLPEGRVAWASADESRQSEAHPTYHQFACLDRTWKILNKLEDLAKEHNKSAAQVSLRWLLQRQGVTSVVIGARTIQQLEDNLGAASGWQLTAKQMSELNEVSSFPISYPHNMVLSENKGRKRQI